MMLRGDHILHGMRGCLLDKQTSQLSAPSNIESGDSFFPRHVDTELSV